MANTTMISKEEASLLRQEALHQLDQLQTASQDPTTSIKSWIHPNRIALTPDNSTDTCRFFHHSGFLHVRNFCDAAQVERLKAKMAQLVEDEWHPGGKVNKGDDGDGDGGGVESFGTDDAQNAARGDYFLESSDKVHYFAEPEALTTTTTTTDDGDSQHQQPQQPRLAEAFQNNKIAALNKAGHALHLEPNNNPFRDYCCSQKVLKLVLDLGWTDPVVPQSMYIFKQARTGGVVNSHQDSTFLFTTPRQTCLGLWLALHDATLDNGCLWVRPKSHHESVRRQYKRNPRHFMNEQSNRAADDSSNSNKKDEEPTFVMEELTTTTSSSANDEIPWDGSLPGTGTVSDLLDAGFVPVECQAGDLLAFNGELDHLSLANGSDQPRHTFQLHLVEGPQASAGAGGAGGVTWSPSNWLQYPTGKPFLRLLDDNTTTTK